MTLSRGVEPAQREEKSFRHFEIFIFFEDFIDVVVYLKTHWPVKKIKRTVGKHRMNGAGNKKTTAPENHTRAEHFFRMLHEKKIMVCQ